MAFGFDPPAINPTKGSTFAVNVTLAGASDVFTVPVLIHYDPKLMELLNVSNGGLLSQDGQAVALVHRDDPSSGDLQISATRPPGTPGINGTGTVFTLTFMAKAPGNGMIAVTRPVARNSAMKALPAAGASATVTVK
jgi:general secretion pathway protein D